MSSFIFNLFEEEMKWILQNMIDRLVYRYLDNLLDIISPHEVKTTFNSIIFILESLEFIINFKKNEDKTKLSFIEIELDIIKMK